MRVQFVERVGVPTIVAVAAAVVLAYSLWGAALLGQAQSAGLSQGQGDSSANL